MNFKRMMICFIGFYLCFDLTALAAKRHFIVAHDGGVDDLIALAIVSLQKDIDVEHIIVSPADSYRQPAIATSRALMDFINQPNYTLSADTTSGVNPFPSLWREDSIKLARIKALTPTQTLAQDKRILSTDPAKHLIAALDGKRQYEILVTGPLTVLARALKKQPNIKKNIKQVYFMGGAFEVIGNVVHGNTKPVAEWNVYNDALAVATVLKSRVPMVFIALDATNQAPITPQFINRLKRIQNPLAQLFYQAWGVVFGQLFEQHYQKRYFFWDTLAAAYAIDPRLGDTIDKKVAVKLSGEAEGQTYFSAHGFKAKILKTVDKAQLEALILNTVAAFDAKSHTES